MKTILILMNCHGEEIHNYLNNIPEIFENFKIKFISTYSNLNNSSILSEISNCNILITNNVKNYELLNFSNIIKYVKPICIVIKIEWIRFNGFWPLTFTSHILFNYDESTISSNNYEDYLNYQIDKNLIINNFNESLKKLKILDNDSDIKFYDFFLENYKYQQLFRDHNHLSHFFFKHVMKQIIVKIDKNINLECIDKINFPYTYGHKFRYKQILNIVKQTLEIKFDDDKLDFFNKTTTNEKFFYFLKEAHKYNTIEEIEKIYNEKIN